MGKQYRYMGHHATELEDGETRPWVGPGDLVELNEVSEGSQAMIDEGTLVDTEAITQEAQKAEAEAQKAAKAEAAEAEAEEAAEATTTEVKKGGK